MKNTNQIERFLKRKSVTAILGDHYVLNEKQANRLLLILDEPKKVKQLEDWLGTLAQFVRNDLINLAKSKLIHQSSNFMLYGRVSFDIIQQKLSSLL